MSAQDLSEWEFCRRSRHLRTELVVNCQDCSLVGVWEREDADPDEHPHANTDHELEYQALGDAIDSILPESLEVTVR